MDVLDISHEEEVESTDSHVCDVCGAVYKHRASLKRHLHSHARQDRVYKCDNCGKSFQYKYLLSTHQRRQHQNTHPHICPQCGNVFSSLPSLTNHIRNVHQERKLSCDICGKKCKDNFALKRHVQSHEKSTTPCPKCSRECKDMDKHALRCSSIAKPKAYTCEICNKKFVAKAYLRQHLKNKHDPKDHFCVCGKSFQYPFSLKRHQKICLKVK